MKIEEYLPTIQKNIFLENYTTFKIGGPAKYFLEVKTKEDLIKAILAAKKCNLPFFVLGGGSNLLVSDKGFPGIVIKMLNTKYKIQNTKIVAETGTGLGQLVSAVARTGLTGLEWAAGIPGTVGGAIYGNTGAFGKSMSDIVKSVEVLESRVKENKKYILKIKKFSNKNCHFRYRDSIFKQSPNLIILGAKLQLKKGNQKEILTKMKDYLNYRKETQPRNFPSAGSVFKNFTPYRNEVSGAGPKELREFKKTRIIPAAWLIDRCGLKGKRIGNVKISEKHANFIVNLGKGKAKDVIKLIKLIKQRVKNKFGIDLEEEITILS